MGTMGYKHESHGRQRRDHDAPRCRRRRSILRSSLASTASRKSASSSRINLTDIVVKGSWMGPAVAPVPHVNAPVADFPVRRVLGAHHFIADLTLPFGRKIHDYNKEAEQAAVTGLAAE